MQYNVYSLQCTTMFTYNVIYNLNSEAIQRIHLSKVYILSSAIKPKILNYKLDRKKKSYFHHDFIQQNMTSLKVSWKVWFAEDAESNHAAMNAAGKDNYSKKKSNSIHLWMKCSRSSCCNVYVTLFEFIKIVIGFSSSPCRFNLFKFL